MTTPTDGAPDALDRAIDEAVGDLTAVDAIEARSRARLRARLAEADVTGATRTIEIDSAREGRFVRRWVLVPAAAATLIGLLALAWLATRPAPARDQAHRQPSAPTSAPVARAEAPTGVPRAEPGRPGEPGSVRRMRPAAPAPRIAHPAARVTATNVAVRGPDRLDAYLRALTALPAEVWQRADGAGPPAAPALVVDENSPIRPLAVEQLPGTTWPTDDSNDVNSRGEPR